MPAAALEPVVEAFVKVKVKSLVKVKVKKVHPKMDVVRLKHLLDKAPDLKI